MKLPETVWIGPFQFHIYFDHVKLAVQTSNDQVVAAVGASNSDRLEIMIDDRLPVSRQKDVLIHELFHAIWSFAALRNAGELTEELVVDAMSAPWLHVLRVNPDLVAFLIHGSAADTPEARNSLETLRVLHADDGDQGEEADGEGEVVPSRADHCE